MRKKITREKKNWGRGIEARVEQGSLLGTLDLWLSVITFEPHSLLISWKTDHNLRNNSKSNFTILAFRQDR